MCAPLSAPSPDRLHRSRGQLHRWPIHLVRGTHDVTRQHDHQVHGDRTGGGDRRQTYQQKRDDQAHRLAEYDEQSWSRCRLRSGHRHLDANRPQQSGSQHGDEKQRTKWRHADDGRTHRHDHRHEHQTAKTVLPDILALECRRNGRHPRAPLEFAAKIDSARASLEIRQALPRMGCCVSRGRSLSVPHDRDTRLYHPAK